MTRSRQGLDACVVQCTSENYPGQRDVWEEGCSCVRVGNLRKLQQSIPLALEGDVKLEKDAVEGHC